MDSFPGPDRGAALAVSGTEGLRDKKILIIDDDRIFCDLVSAIFSGEGATIHAAYSGKDGLREFFRHQPNLVLLDHMMPGMNGLEVLERIRELSDTPVIMLSAIDAHDEIVRCLMSGADDYITKPYNAQVLIARVLAAIRRSARSAELPRMPRFDDGYLMFDLESRIVRVANDIVSLSATEFALLSYLVRNSGRVCTFTQIIDNVWGNASLSNEENVHTFVYQLRRKLERDPSRPEYLVSLRSIGYRFQLQ